MHGNNASFQTATTIKIRSNNKDCTKYPKAYYFRWRVQSIQFKIAKIWLMQHKRNLDFIYLVLPVSYKRSIALISRFKNSHYQEKQQLWGNRMSHEGQSGIPALNNSNLWLYIGMRGFFKLTPWHSQKVKVQDPTHSGTFKPCRNQRVLKMTQQSLAFCSTIRQYVLVTHLLINKRFGPVLGQWIPCEFSACGRHAIFPPRSDLPELASWTHALLCSR